MIHIHKTFVYNLNMYLYLLILFNFVFDTLLSILYTDTHIQMTLFIYL